MSDEKIIPAQTKETTISPLWLFTLLALVLGGWLLYKSISEAGIRIHIHFDDAQGIQSGRTAIRYQGVDIGIVRKVALDENFTGVNAEAEIFPQAAQLLRKDTLFWLVKPTASITEISGLEALVGGNYIGVLPGIEKAEETNFIAATSQPNIDPNGNNLLLYLSTHDLGSLSVGSGVYYKKIQVGEIFNYELSENHQEVQLSVKIQDKYAHLIKENSRFWNISGVKADIGLHGADIEIGSLRSLLTGGVAFDSPKTGNVANVYSIFHLYPSINEAERGIAITIELPTDHGIKDSNLPITFKGTDIGKLNSIKPNENFNGFIATANIDPSMQWLLKAGSQFIIEQPEINFTGIKHLSNYVTGNTLTIKQGEGEERTTFIAKTEENIITSNPNSLKIKLTTSDVWGISNSTKVIYKGIEVGFVEKYELKNDKTYVDLVIYSAYRHLVKSRTRFYRQGGISASLDEDGLAVNVSPAAQLLQAAISFTSEGSSKRATQYHLFDSKSQAEKAKSAKQGFQHFTLITDNLPSISQHSPVMYKNVTVGSVDDFVLEKSRVKIVIKIENQYKHLVTKNTVFWDHSGVGIKASFSGVDIQTGSLKSIINGGISFGELKGIANKQGKAWILYKSLTAAQNQGISILFTSKKAHGLKIGSEIRYQGVQIGEITVITPQFDKDAIKIGAIIYPEFAKSVAKKSSYFWVSVPSISLSKTENLDSLFTPYISVLPGAGNPASNFTLHESQKFVDGLTLILESEKRDSIKVGTPILFRDFEVGNVTDVRLGHFADRVLIEIKILEKYKHLVRDNSVFWNYSGINVDLGITGANIKAGTVENILQGGIAFATPKRKKLAPAAKKNQHFLLHREPRAEWETWRTAIPPAH